MRCEIIPFERLRGLTLVEITGLKEGSDEVIFRTADRTFRMYHWQDCCESVSIEDIVGDVSDLIGSPLVLAEEVTDQNAAQPAGWKQSDSNDSYTWTFYRLQTANGLVSIRWYGTSNGYYSERVTFEELNPKENVEDVED